ncbi:hypothetical protein QVD17_41246 [Tagetes erecta]|uniref:Uncharacterized protein n=1 Tax=Tagetes erecta TaxID=13708 RepID=A0AAD8JQP2_TARER|nr:hypothetical protein QVD17_41246 [Tagetes erecta]
MKSASCGGKTTYKAALLNKRGTAICIFSISQWIHERSDQIRIQVIASNYQTIDLINLVVRKGCNYQSKYGVFWKGFQKQKSGTNESSCNDTFNDGSPCYYSSTEFIYENYAIINFLGSNVTVISKNAKQIVYKRALTALAIVVDFYYAQPFQMVSKQEGICHQEEHLRSAMQRYKSISDGKEETHISASSI